MFFPKNYNFGQMFQEMSGSILEISELFGNLAKEFKDIEWYSKKAEIIEKQVDSVVHNIVNQLNTAFITPFDREDLHKLVVDVDSIVDEIENVIHMLKLYNISNKPSFIDRFSIIFIDLSKSLQSLMIETFKNKRDMNLIDKNVVAIKMLERQADEVYLESISKIFSEEKDPIELIKWKDIIQQLEDIADLYKTVSNTVVNMLIKMW